MTYISSYASGLLIFLFPVSLVILFPENSMDFFTFKQAEFFEGTFHVNNLHILLIIWSVLFGIIIYTELVFRYLSAGKGSQGSVEYSRILTDISTPTGAINLTFKPIEGLVNEKDKKVYDFLSISEGEASELIEMAENYRKNFANMVQEKERNENTQVKNDG